MAKFHHDWPTPREIAGAIAGAFLWAVALILLVIFVGAFEDRNAPSPATDGSFMESPAWPRSST